MPIKIDLKEPDSNPMVNIIKYSPLIKPHTRGIECYILSLLLLVTVQLCSSGVYSLLK